MNKIHPTSIVSTKAIIGNDVEIGPFSVISDDVEIGDNIKIGPHVNIYDGARISNGVEIFQGASISNTPQDLKFADEKTYLYIGDNTVVREFATLHRGTIATGQTKIGKNCLLMAYSHVAHDCTLGNNIILANAVQLGGHVEIDDWAILGGGTAIHQFVKIGSHIITSGGSMVNGDIPPYIMITGFPARFVGLNTVGLKRRGFTSDDITVIKDTYHLFYNSGLAMTAAKEKIAGKYSDHPLVSKILQFMNDSTRTIIRK
jgi:UDP-N-acetylglucosamine acyltransferase